MILFPLMATWMLFEIVGATPLPAFVPSRREHRQRRDLVPSRRI